MQWMGEWSTDARGGQSGGCRLVATVTEPPTPDAFFERLCLLALEVVRNSRGASELEMAGVWAVMFCSLAGRASLAMMLIEAGVLEAAVAALQQSSPTDWIT